MNRVYNFSSGPAMLPAKVLEIAQKELLQYRDTGQSVMEMSHRSPEYRGIQTACENDLRELLQISDDYHLLFIQGGASLQFSMIPMNLAQNKVQMINTGEWTKKAFKEHQKLVETQIIADSEAAKFTYIPQVEPEAIDQNSDYLYICQNNTIFGSQYHSLPPAGNLPLVADLSSMILSEPLDIKKYGLVFAGAQKNMGPAGFCLVIIKKDWLKPTTDNLATMLDYHTYIDNDSLFNTPPTYSIYLCGLVCQWLLHDIGGLDNMQAINQAKAQLLYDYLDESTYFTNPINKADRSLMNVTFVTPDPQTDEQFVAQAKTRGLINLAGHRLIGGMRASIYNAMPPEGVQALVEFMKEFEIHNA